MRTTEELASTDITDEAVEALKESRVRDVVLLGRRGRLKPPFRQRRFESWVRSRDVNFPSNRLR